MREDAVEGPFDLRRTLRFMLLWGASTWLRVDDTGAWYAQRTADGPATICIRHRGDRLVTAGWGPGAETLLGDVPMLCGLGNRGVADVEPRSDRMRDLRIRMIGTRQGRSGQIFPQLVSVALGQKVTGANGKRSLYGIARRWGERAPGPREDLSLLPTPRELEARPYYEYSRLGIERKRADLVRRIASRASALQRAARMPFAEARAHLEKLPGIGPWTSGIIMGGVLGDSDAVPIGDYHLPNFVSWSLAREPRATDARMMELLEPYAGQRGLVVRMIKTSGHAPPKWGPRMEVQDIRDLG